MSEIGSGSAFDALNQLVQFVAGLVTIAAFAQAGRTRTSRGAPNKFIAAGLVIGSLLTALSILNFVQQRSLAKTLEAMSSHPQLFSVASDGVTRMEIETAPGGLCTLSRIGGTSEQNFCDLHLERAGVWLFTAEKHGDLVVNCTAQCYGVKDSRGIR